MVKASVNDGLFKRFLQSKPEPTIAQLVDLALDGHEAICHLALEAIMDRYKASQFAISEFTNSVYGNSFLRMHVARIWSFLKEAQSYREYDLTALIHNCTSSTKDVAAELEEAYLRHIGSLPASVIRSLAKIFEEDRRMYWQELFVRDLVNPNIARDFLSYPETAVQAGRWILRYRERYPDGRGPFRGREHPNTVTTERQVSTEDLLPLLNIPVLRAKSAKALMGMTVDRGQVSRALQILQSLKASEDSRGLKMMMRWLLKEADRHPRIYIELLKFGCSGRVRKRIYDRLIACMQMWLEEADLDTQAARVAIHLAEDPLRRKLSLALKQFRWAESQKRKINRTQKLYQQLGGRQSY